MNIPQWLLDVVQSFGRNIGLEALPLSERGAAALTFDTGVAFRLEYTPGTLSLVLTVPMQNSDTEAIKRLLGYAQPDVQPSFVLHVGYHEPTGRAFFMSRFGEREVSLQMLNAVFTELWEIAEDFRARNV